MHQLGHRRTGSVADSRKTLREREKRKNYGERKVLCDFNPMVKQKLIHINKHMHRLCVLYTIDIIQRNPEKSNKEGMSFISLTHYKKIISFPIKI